MNEIPLEILCVDQCKLPLDKPFKDNPMPKLTHRQKVSICHNCDPVSASLCEYCPPDYDMFEPRETEPNNRPLHYKVRSDATASNNVQRLNKNRLGAC